MRRSAKATDRLRYMVIDALCNMVRRNDDTQVPIGKGVARILYGMWESQFGPLLPDDLRDLIWNTSYEVEILEPASKVVLDIEQRAVDGVPPTTLDSKTALLALALTANRRLYRDAWSWTLTVNQNEECREALRKRERKEGVYEGNDSWYDY